MSHVAGSQEIATEGEANDAARLVDSVRQRILEPAERAELSELAGSAPAYRGPPSAGLVPSRGNTRVVDRARLTRERLHRYRQRLHGVGVGAVGG